MPSSKYKNPEEIKEMFSNLSPRYDIANAVLSLGFYKSWYKRLIDIMEIRDGLKILDCATGTGNLPILVAQKYQNVTICGVDFSDRMLTIAREKMKKLKLSISFMLTDILNLPFDDNYFDIATICYGIRNVIDPIQCLKEMSRVVKQGGQVFILEFGNPTGILKIVYEPYRQFILPVMGRIVTGDRVAYHYLAETSSQFPSGSKFIKLMQSTNLFKNINAIPIFGGIAYLYKGRVV